MTIQALAWAIDQPLPGTAKLVLLAMANHADHTTGFVHFTASTIAQEASIQERSLWRYLGALERNQFVVRAAAAEGARAYWLTLDRDPAIGWGWSASDKTSEEAEAAESDAPPEPSKEIAPRVAPPTFRRAEQDRARKDAEAAILDRAAEGFPVIEGSRAHEAWRDHYRGTGKMLPYIRSMVVNGKECRGFPMPSLFPPAERAEDDGALE